MSALGFFGGMVRGQAQPQAAPADPAGFYDFLTFGGLFVGQGQLTSPPLARGRGGFRGAGRYTELWLASERAARRRQEQLRQQLPVLRRQLWQRLIHQGMAQERQRQQRRVEASIYTVLLSEV